MQNSILVGDGMKWKNQGRNLVTVGSSNYEAAMPVSLSKFQPCQNPSWSYQELNSPPG